MKIQAQSSLLLRQALQKAAKCVDPKNAMSYCTSMTFCVFSLLFLAIA